MAQALGTYLDESATDNNALPVAVVAGVLLNWNSFAWLDIEWEKAGKVYGLSSVHMKDFGKHGKFKDFPEADRRDLFARLTKIINENKGWSIAATLSTAQYTTHFSWLGKRGWSQYAACFLLSAVLQGKHLDHEGYPYDVPFTLDDGNAYKDQVSAAHGHILNDFQEYPYHCGTLSFCDDEKIRALQAADVIAWAVRRRASRLPFEHGFDPLTGIFEKDHIEQPFEEAWMQELSEDLRAKYEDMSPQTKVD